MMNLFRTLYNDSIQLAIRTYANHLLVIIAFFLPLNRGAITSGFFILIILLLLCKDLFTQIKTVLTNRVILSFIALLLLHTIGITYSDDPHRSSHYAHEMIFLLYSIIIVIFAEYRFLVRIFSAFILGVFLSELLSYGFIFELLTSPIPSLFDGSPIASKNEPSPFTFHAEYGYILSITSALILQRLLIKTTKIEKIIFILFLTTITMNVFFNSARTGYILFFISNGTILLFHYKKQILKKLYLILPFILLLITIAWNSSTNIQREYHETLTSISDITHGNFHSSLGTRLDFLRMGINALKESNPLIGFGTDMHGLAVYNQAVKENNTEIMNWLLYTGQGSGRIFFIDCEYNSILLQFGIVGLFIYLNLFFQIARFRQQDPALNIIKNMLLVSSVFYAFASSVFSGMLVPMLFVFLVSLTLIQPEHEKSLLGDINTKSLLGYTLFTVFLFTLSKVT
jgi:O-antigen ligase